MNPTEISEKGLETLIMPHLTGLDGFAFDAAAKAAAESPDVLIAAKAARAGWLAGNPKDYDRTHAPDVPQVFSFLHATQPDTVQKLGIVSYPPDLQADGVKAALQQAELICADWAGS